MIEISKSIFISRAAEDIFAYVTDPNHTHEWQEDTISASTDGELSVGVTGSYTQRLMGREVESATECIAYDPPYRIGWQTIGGPIKFHATYDLEPQDGGTLVVQNIEAEAGGFFKVAEGVVAKQAAGGAERDLNNLKAIMES